jgi:hypothetical protein
LFDNGLAHAMTVNPVGDEMSVPVYFAFADPNDV